MNLKKQRILILSGAALFFALIGFGELYFGIKEFKDCKDNTLIKAVLSNSPNLRSEGRFKAVSTFKIIGYPQVVFKLNCGAVEEFSNLKKGDSILFRIPEHFASRLKSPINNESIEDYFFKRNSNNIPVSALSTSSTIYETLEDYEQNILESQILFGCFFTLVCLTFSFFLLRVILRKTYKANESN